MRNEYDFSKAKRGPVLKGARGKTRITIRVDDDILDWFRGQVHDAGGGSYQAMMNDALRAFMDGPPESLEKTVRRVVKEELRRARARAPSRHRSPAA